MKTRVTSLPPSLWAHGAGRVCGGAHGREGNEGGGGGQEEGWPSRAALRRAASSLGVPCRPAKRRPEPLVHLRPQRGLSGAEVGAPTSVIAATPSLWHDAVTTDLLVTTAAADPENRSRVLGTGPEPTRSGSRTAYGRRAAVPGSSHFTDGPAQAY